MRRVLDDAKFYAKNKRAHDRRAMRDLSAHPSDLEALGPVLARRIPLTIGANRASDILAALALAEDYRIRIAIQGGAEAWKVADALAKAKVTVMLTPSSNLPGSFDTLGSRLDNAALLAAAGVEVVIADMGEVHNIRNITQEAGIAVAYGLDREQALSALTLNVARVYGMDQRYGSIATGKVANLVVWPGDPFELSNMPDQVYIRGRAIPMVSRQTLLRDRYLDLSKYAP
jgi:imidazolonepropionase-like amidohydrolase